MRRRKVNPNSITILHELVCYLGWMEWNRSVNSQSWLIYLKSTHSLVIINGPCQVLAGPNAEDVKAVQVWVAITNYLVQHPRQNAADVTENKTRVDASKHFLVLPHPNIGGKKRKRTSSISQDKKWNAWMRSAPLCSLVEKKEKQVACCNGKWWSKGPTWHMIPINMRYSRPKWFGSRLGTVNSPILLRRGWLHKNDGCFEYAITCAIIHALKSQRSQGIEREKKKHLSDRPCKKNNTKTLSEMVSSSLLFIIRDFVNICACPINVFCSDSKSICYLKHFL